MKKMFDFFILTLKEAKKLLSLNAFFMKHLLSLPATGYPRKLLAVDFLTYWSIVGPKTATKRGCGANGKSGESRR